MDLHVPLRWVACDAVFSSLAEYSLSDCIIGRFQRDDALNSYGLDFLYITSYLSLTISLADNVPPLTLLRCWVAPCLYDSVKINSSIALTKVRPIFFGADTPLCGFRRRLPSCPLHISALILGGRHASATLEDPRSRDLL
jgi:hypothetical protein